MQPIRDTWTMTKRSLRHITRSIDTIITVVLMPIAFLLLFVYIFGGAIGDHTSSGQYSNYITPAIIVMTVISGISYAALRLNTDLQSGIINRFRSMPLAPSSILGGQALSSTLSNFVSCFIVLAVAFGVGFRSRAGILAWLLFVGLLILFILAMTWIALFFGLLAKSTEGAGAFSYILILLIFISPAFVTTSSMTRLLRGFANNQPLTPIIETIRSLLTTGTAGSKVWIAIAWCVGILVVMYICSIRMYRRKTFSVNT